MTTILKMAVTLSTALLLASHAQAGPEGEAESADSGGAGLFGTVEKAVKRGASAAVSGIERGAKAAGSGIETGVKAAAGGVETGAKATGRVAGRVANSIGAASAASGE